MALFKKIITATGIERYFKDGKYIKKEDVENLSPAVRALGNGDSLDIGEAPLPPEETNEEEDLTPYQPPVSYLSGELATRRRWLNGKDYWLTDEEYQMTLGKLAQAVREKDAVDT